MSISKITNNLTDVVITKINEEVIVEIEPSAYAGGGETTFVYPFTVTSNSVILPFGYASENLGWKRPHRNFFLKSRGTFTGELRPMQREVKTEIVNHLAKTGCCKVSAYPGAGKTITSIYLAIKYGFKTLILVKGLVMMKQWGDEIKRFTDCKSQVLTAKTKELKSDCDFYIMNLINVPKKHANFYENIGMVIVDEIHQATSRVFSESLRYVSPRYLLGLSATPYRPDAFNKLLDLYFGTNIVIRKLWRPHTVYRYDTGIKPKIERSYNGRVNWNVLLDSLASNTRRNKMIVNVVKQFPDRNIMILCKRVDLQAKPLVDMLNDAGESVTSLYRSATEFDKEARVLVATIQKGGTGFSHEKLDMLILAADCVEYFYQYLCRVIRRPDVIPIIVDMVDNYSVLTKHFAIRKKVYQDIGGKIKRYSILKK